MMCRTAVLCCLLVSFAWPRAWADDSVATMPEAATWQEHHFAFNFLGFTSTYSCDGLADQLRVLLLAAGARADVKSVAGACSSGYGRPDKFARADLTFYTLSPVAATAKNSPDLGKPLLARWRTVTLATNSPQRLLIGDCELVDQFRTTLLPLFTVRNVENHTTCIPRQDAGSVIDLRFDVLSPDAPISTPASP